MFKLLAATLAAFYAVLLIFGEPSESADVARKDTRGGFDLSLAAFATPKSAVQTSKLMSGMSDAEAIRRAMDAGVAYRNERISKPLRGYIATVATATVLEASVDTGQATDFWYVTGSRVNLRAGPGTGNGVVGQLTLGTEAEVLGQGNGWYQIRTADGATSGWIYGKYLSDQRPG